MKKVIHLEDQGQDLLSLVVENQMIVEERPFDRGLFTGGFIPDLELEVGKPCPLHHPPHFIYGYLKYKVTKIEKL